jgi:hypothetical protein
LKAEPKSLAQAKSGIAIINTKINVIKNLENFMLLYGLINVDLLYPILSLST